MKQSRKIICGLSVLCVALIIVVVALSVKILTPQASDSRERQMFQASNGGGQTVDGQLLTPETQTSGEEAQAPAMQTPGGDSQAPPSNPVGQNRDRSQGTQDIGREAAKTAALAHAGLSEAEVTGMDVEQEWEDGRLEYEIEFWYGNTEYDYTIDALTGEVLKYEQEQHSGIQAPVAQAPDGEVQASGGDSPASPSNPAGQNQDRNQGTQDIGQEAAKTAALNHVGLSEAEVTGMKVEQEWEDGRLEYDIEFWCGNTEYDYTIDGYTGIVLKHEQEQHKGIQAPAGQASGSSGLNQESRDIGREAAKSAALTHAGLSETQVTGMKVEQDWEDGRLEYDVEFKSGGMEYDYTIDGVTGTVLSFEKEVDD